MTDATEPLPQALPASHQTAPADYLKVAFEAWPYVFMSVSVIGLIYVGLNAIR